MVPCFQEKEDKGDDEEPQANVIPKWKAGPVTAIHFSEEDEEETPPEPEPEPEAAPAEEAAPEEGAEPVEGGESQSVWLVTWLSCSDVKWWGAGIFLHFKVLSSVYLYIRTTRPNTVPQTKLNTVSQTKLNTVSQSKRVTVSQTKLKTVTN